MRSRPVRTERGAASPTLVLAVLAGALTLALGAVLGIEYFGEDDPTPGDRVAAAVTASSSPQAVAEQAALAFLDVDYRDMAPRIQKVLDLATGRFYDEYKAAEANLTTGTQQSEATSAGVVRQVGTSAVSASTARILVAADSTVGNKVIAAARARGETVKDQRSYRFQIDLVLVEGAWRVENLGFVR